MSHDLSRKNVLNCARGHVKLNNNLNIVKIYSIQIKIVVDGSLTSIC